ncbi:MAG: hypothetical protein KDD48_01940 [Bdellovibrionales bacterium]|nr:hypothetical protein [Bdellovibrionales bacterium]
MINCRSSLLLLLFSSCCLSSTLSINEIKRLDKGEVITTLEKIPGTKYDKATSIGTVDASPQKVYDILIDFESYESFIPKVKESSVLKKEDQVVYYKSHVNMPWPISDIFYNCKATLHPENYSIDFELVPGTGIGVKSFEGSWHFEAYKSNPKITLARYILHYEPETNYPAWAVRIGSKATIGKNIIAVRQRVKELENLASK